MEEPSSLVVRVESKLKDLLVDHGYSDEEASIKAASVFSEQSIAAASDNENALRDRILEALKSSSSLPFYEQVVQKALEKCG